MMIKKNVRPTSNPAAASGTANKSASSSSCHGGVGVGDGASVGSDFSDDGDHPLGSPDNKHDVDVTSDDGGGGGSNSRSFQNGDDVLSRKGNGQQPLKCDQCDYETFSFGQLQTHQRGHENDPKKPFQCDICNMKFSNGANMRRHRVRHTGVKPFECRVCQKRFFRKDHLAEHMTTHNKKLPFHCPVCNKGFQRQIAMRAHFQNEHVGNVEGQKTCGLCGYNAGSLKGLGVHMAKKHGIDLDDPSPAAAAAAAAAAAQLVASAAGVGSHNFHDSPLMHSLQFGAAVNMDRQSSCPPSPTPSMGLVPSHFLAPQVEISFAQPPSPGTHNPALTSAESATAMIPGGANGDASMDAPSPPPPPTSTTTTNGSNKSSALVTALGMSHHNLHLHNGHHHHHHHHQPQIENGQKLSPTPSSSSSTSSLSDVNSDCHDDGPSRLAIDTGEYPPVYSIKREREPNSSDEGCNNLPPQQTPPTANNNKRFCPAESLKKRFLSRLDGVSGDPSPANNVSSNSDADAVTGLNGDEGDTKRPNAEAEADGANNIGETRCSRSPSPTVQNLIKISPLKSLLRHHHNQIQRQQQVNGHGNGANGHQHPGDPFQPSNNNSLPVGFFPAKFGHQCVFCSIVFPDQTLYFLHKGFHSEGNPWKCNICTEQYANVYEFNAHLLSKPHQ